MRPATNNIIVNMVMSFNLYKPFLMATAAKRVPFWVDRMADQPGINTLVGFRGNEQKEEINVPG
jgi:hypothetical protein